MLMLSKGSNESVSFPELGITIHFLRVHAGKAKIGIDAGPDMRICSDAVDAEAVIQAIKLPKQTTSVPREIRHEIRHEIRNELHGVSVGIHLLREQMKMGMHEDAEETFETLRQSLSNLDQHELLESPSSKIDSGHTTKPQFS